MIKWKYNKYKKKGEEVKVGMREVREIYMGVKKKKMLKKGWTETII